MVNFLSYPSANPSAKMIFLVLVSFFIWTILSFVTNTLSIDLGSFAEEHGFIEIMTVALVSLTSLISLFAFYRTQNRNWIIYSIWMALFSLRELNFHKAFTQDSILKSKFYLSPDTPITEKIIGGGFIISLIILLFITLRHFWLQRLRLIKLSFTTAETIGFSALSLILLAKTLDSLFRLAPPLKNYKLDSIFSLQLIEEGLEMTGAFLFFYCAYYFIRSGVNSNK